MQKINKTLGFKRHMYYPKRTFYHFVGLANCSTIMTVLENVEPPLNPKKHR